MGHQKKQKDIQIPLEKEEKTIHRLQTIYQKQKMAETIKAH